MFVQVEVDEENRPNESAFVSVSSDDIGGTDDVFLSIANSTELAVEPDTFRLVRMTPFEAEVLLTALANIVYA